MGTSCNLFVDDKFEKGCFTKRHDSYIDGGFGEKLVELLEKDEYKNLTSDELIEKLKKLFAGDDDIEFDDQKYKASNHDYIYLIKNSKLYQLKNKNDARTYEEYFLSKYGIGCEAVKLDIDRVELIDVKEKLKLLREKTKSNTNDDWEKKHTEKNIEAIKNMYQSFDVRRVVSYDNGLKVIDYTLKQKSDVLTTAYRILEALEDKEGISRYINNNWRCIKKRTLLRINMFVNFEIPVASYYCSDDIHVNIYHYVDYFSSTVRNDGIGTLLNIFDRKTKEKYDRIMKFLKDGCEVKTELVKEVKDKESCFEINAPIHITASTEEELLEKYNDCIELFKSMKF